MIYISHRGLINGPDKLLENNPEVILETISKGFDCEIDLWIHESRIFLGHDEPQYEINSCWLERNGLWIHAKNIESLAWLNTTNYNYFWHEDDHYTLTSHNYIWAHPMSMTTENCILVMPEYVDTELNIIADRKYCGVCSDYIEQIRNM
jgi:hypothetical protein